MQHSLADQHLKTYEEIKTMTRWMDCFEERTFFLSNSFIARKSYS